MRENSITSVAETRICFFMQDIFSPVWCWLTLGFSRCASWLKALAKLKSTRIQTQLIRCLLALVRGGTSISSSNRHFCSQVDAGIWGPSCILFLLKNLTLFVAVKGGLAIWPLSVDLDEITPTDLTAVMGLVPSVLSNVPSQVPHWYTL